MRTYKRISRGFTLIELLVVIAIIAILAAILFPVFAKARDRAKNTTSINNMKQMSLAFMGYFADNDDKFMPYVQGESGPGAQGARMGWTQRLYPYVKNYEVYRNPFNNKSNFSYSMNAVSTNRGLAQVRNPTKFIHLLECAGSGDQRYKPNFEGTTEQDWRTYGDADLSTEYGQTNQPDGNVYSTSAGGLDYSRANNAMPIKNVRDGSNLSIGRLHFPGWYNGGNSLMFLDGHVQWFRDWDYNKMTFDPTIS